MINPAIGILTTTSIGGVAMVLQNTKNNKGPITKEGVFYEKAQEKCNYAKIFDENLDFDNCLKKEIMIIEKEYSPMTDCLFGVGIFLGLTMILITIVIFVSKWIWD